jgi:hypothetical protein
MAPRPLCHFDFDRVMAGSPSLNIRCAMALHT